MQLQNCQVLQTEACRVVGPGAQFQERNRQLALHGDAGSSGGTTSPKLLLSIVPSHNGTALYCCCLACRVRSRFFSATIWPCSAPEVAVRSRGQPHVLMAVWPVPKACYAARKTVVTCIQVHTYAQQLVPPA